MSGACGQRVLDICKSEPVGALAPRKWDLCAFGDEVNKYPLNVSCLGCKKEITGKERLPKCARSRFTQYWSVRSQLEMTTTELAGNLYSGTECQKVGPRLGKTAPKFLPNVFQKDWPRHKVACKWIKGARLVNGVRRGLKAFDC